MSALRAAERQAVAAAKSLRDYQKRCEELGNCGDDEVHYLERLDQALADVEKNTREKPRK